MKKREELPITSCVLIITVASILVYIQYTSDLNSPALFILKAALQPLAVAILICFLVYSAFRKSKLILIAALFAITINTPLLLPKLSFLDSDYNIDEQVNQSDFVAATFSTLTRTKSIEDIILFIEAEKPDLFCLQELSKPHRVSLLKRLKNRYPYSRSSKSNNQLTLSIYPLHATNDDGYRQSSVLTHPIWGEIDVINVHMPRPYRSTTLAKSWVSLFEEINKQSKTILCGDLNITPNNTLYDLLTHQFGMKDALKSGYGFTFPNAQRKSALLGTLIRIDYILTLGFITSQTRTINGSDLSDHRAVLTNIGLRERSSYE